MLLKKKKLDAICFTTFTVQCMLVDMHMLYSIIGYNLIQYFNAFMRMGVLTVIVEMLFKSYTTLKSIIQLLLEKVMNELSCTVIVKFKSLHTFLHPTTP